MLRLVMKDFSVQKRSFLNYVFIALFLSIFFAISGAQQMIFVMGTFPIIYGFTNRALYEDEKNNTLRLLAALPVKREVLVYARYLSVGIVTAAVSLFFSGFYILLAKQGIISLDDVTGTKLFIVSITSVFVVMMSIYLPIAFKIGYIKASTANRFILLGFFGLIGVLGAALGKFFKGAPPEFVLKLSAAAESLNPDSALIIIAAAAIAIYLMSAKLSVRFFQARNLF